MPHTGQATAKAVPHSPQNFLSGAFVVPHAGQFKIFSDVTVGSIGSRTPRVNAPTSLLDQSNKLCTQRLHECSRLGDPNPVRAEVPKVERDQPTAFGLQSRDEDRSVLRIGLVSIYELGHEIQRAHGQHRARKIEQGSKGGQCGRQLLGEIALNLYACLFRNADLDDSKLAELQDHMARAGH